MTTQMTEQQNLPTERARATVSDDLVWIMDTARFEHMWRIAQAMASAKLMPEHLRNSPSDCMLVVEQSNRWGMSPFAVASCTYSVGGKLGYEGKLVAGVINARGNLKHRLSYQYEGSPDKKETLACTVSGTIQGETEPRTVRVTWRQGDGMSKGAKDKWASQPEQQLAYFGARAWARRHMPELLLGIYTPEELLDAEGDMRDVTPASKKVTAEERRARMHEVESVEIVDDDGEVHYVQAGAAEQFLRDHPGAYRAADGPPPDPDDDARQSALELRQAQGGEPGTATPADPPSPAGGPSAAPRNGNGNGVSRPVTVVMLDGSEIAGPPADVMPKLQAEFERLTTEDGYFKLRDGNANVIRRNAKARSWADAAGERLGIQLDQSDLGLPR